MKGGFLVEGERVLLTLEENKGRADQEEPQ